jgi:hypothetical protein
MTINRRIIVEVNGQGGGSNQTTITFDPTATGMNSLRHKVEEALRYPLMLVFHPVPESDPNYSSYSDWSQCTISISPPICQAEGGDCWNRLLHEEEQATQVCWQCQEKAEGGEE